MKLHSRLERVEKLARERAEEMERKSRKGWHQLTIYAGVELTPAQRAMLEHNQSTQGNGAGFRSITISRQRKQ